MLHTLTSHHSFRLQSSCDELCYLNDISNLPALLKRSHRYQKPCLVLGYGSNVIFPNHYNGMVLLNRIYGIELIWQTEDRVCVSVGAGEIWHDFVSYSLSRQWFGLENLALIPGSVGAAPVQNIGAYGVELSQFFDGCSVYCRDTDCIRMLSFDDCQFGYRDSIFKRDLAGRFIILAVRFVLSKISKPKYTYPRLLYFLQGKQKPITSESVFHAVCQIRDSRLPSVSKVGTVGSFFINPIVSEVFFLRLKRRYLCQFDHHTMADGQVKLFAGNLLTLAGWKGVGSGGFYFCNINPIVLTHLGSGKYEDLISLIQKVQDSVYKLFGLMLQVEPEMIQL